MQSTQSTDNPPPQQMPARRGSGTPFLVLLAAAGVIIVLAIAACAGALLLVGSFKSIAATEVTLESGRTIRFVTDRGGSFASSSSDTGTFKLGSTQLVVTPDSVTLNGSELAELDPAEMQIEITYLSREFRVIADNVVVGKAEQTALEPNNSPQTD
jgi:hypothetical protein